MEEPRWYSHGDNAALRLRIEHLEETLRESESGRRALLAEVDRKIGRMELVTERLQVLDAAVAEIETKLGGSDV